MTELHEYGIMQENSNTRAHVCAVVHRVYVFDTISARRVIRKGQYPVREATQKGVEGRTATGWLVPPDHIPGMTVLRVRECTWNALNFSEDRSTSERGREAVRLVTAMIRRGRFPFPADADGAEVSIEIEGTDIIASIPAQTRRIQVKCDRRGGHKELGGTGNLFLQKAERNPLGRHEGKQSIRCDNLFGSPAIDSPK